MPISAKPLIDATYLIFRLFDSHQLEHRPNEQWVRLEQRVKWLSRGVHQISSTLQHNCRTFYSHHMDFSVLSYSFDMYHMKSCEHQKELPPCINFVLKYLGHLQMSTKCLVLHLCDEICRFCLSLDCHPSTLAGDRPSPCGIHFLMSPTNLINENQLDPSQELIRIEDASA